MDLCIFVYVAFVRFIVRTTFAYTCIVIEVDAIAPASAFMFNYISINEQNSHSVLSTKHISVRVKNIFSAGKTIFVRCSICKDSVPCYLTELFAFSKKCRKGGFLSKNHYVVENSANFIQGGDATWIDI